MQTKVNGDSIRKRTMRNLLNERSKFRTNWNEITIMQIHIAVSSANASESCSFREQG